MKRKSTIISNTNIAKKTARLGVLIALAFVLSYLESLLAFSFAIPGIKPGFANIVVLSCLYILPFSEVAAISFVRILLVSLTFGNPSMALYSLAGASLSLLIMWFLRKINKLSSLTVSICGGFAHNLGQTAVAACILGNAMLYYLPFLMLGGILSGCVTGIVGSLLIKFMKRHLNLFF